MYNYKTEKKIYGILRIKYRLVQKYVNRVGKYKI